MNGQPVIPFQSSTHTEILGSLAMVWSAFGEGRSNSELTRMTIDRGGEFRFVMEDEKLLDALLFMNKLYREELINKDCFLCLPRLADHAGGTVYPGLWSGRNPLGI